MLFRSKLNSTASGLNKTKVEAAAIDLPVVVDASTKPKPTKPKPGQDPMLEETQRILNDYISALVKNGVANTQ